MNTQLIVPAGFVSYLRGGLFGEWGYAAEKLSSLALEFDGNAPDGAYLARLHTFFTIYTLLAEIGLKENDAQGDVVVNLNVGGTYVVKGLKDEHRTLAEQLDEMPKKTQKAMRDAASAKVAEFGLFVEEVEEQVRRLNGQPVEPSTSHSTSRPMLRATPPRVRQSRH
jgi:hypothetical protein